MFFMAATPVLGAVFSPKEPHLNLSEPSRASLCPPFLSFRSFLPSHIVPLCLSLLCINRRDDLPQPLTPKTLGFDLHYVGPEYPRPTRSWGGYRSMVLSFLLHISLP